MNDSWSEEDLKDRLEMIAKMLGEGRRRIEAWGWAFVLWGVAYYAAIIVSGWSPGNVWAWPGAVAAALLIMGLKICFERGRSHGVRPSASLVSQAIASIWLAFGVSITVLLVALGMSGRLDEHLLIATVSALLGMTNAASAIILKWKAQFCCAVVWWVSAANACFGTERRSMTVFLVAIFLCQIVFGLYGTALEAQQRKQARGTGWINA